MNSQRIQPGENQITFSTRSATEQDLPKLRSLTSHDEKWVSWISNQLQNRNNRILVAEQDMQLVGFIYFRVVKRGIDTVDSRLKFLVKSYLGIRGNEFDAIVRPFRVGLIQEIYVTPELRKRGIASALIEACLEWSRIQQICELEVEIRPEDESLISFFRRIGFSDSRYLIKRSLPKVLPKHIKYVRFASKDDLPQLINLVKKQITYQQTLSNSFDLLTEIDWSGYISSIMRNRSAVLLVADYNGQLVGYLEAWLYLKGVYGIRSTILSIARRFFFPSTGQPERFGVMENVYVLPDFRNRVFSQNLALRAAKWFKDNGVEEVLGSVWVENKLTRNISRVIGFKVIKVILTKSV